MKLSVPSFYEAECIRLRAELEDASEISALPERPSCKEALNDMLVRVRLATREGG